MSVLDVDASVILPFPGWALGLAAEAEVASVVAPGAAAGGAIVGGIDGTGKPDGSSSCLFVGQFMIFLPCAALAIARVRSVRYFMLRGDKSTE